MRVQEERRCRRRIPRAEESEALCRIIVMADGPDERLLSVTGTRGLEPRRRVDCPDENLVQRAHELLGSRPQTLSRHRSTNTSL